MNRWHNLPVPVRDDILFQFPVAHILAFCQLDILNCTKDIADISDDSWFWQTYQIKNPWQYIDYKLSKMGLEWEKIEKGSIEDELLINASMVGSVQIVRVLLGLGSGSVRLPPGNSFFTFFEDEDEKSIDIALWLAAQNGHEEIVNLLLDPKKYNINSESANIHSADDTAFILAVKHGHEAIVHLLIKRGADVNALDNQPLLWAVIGNYEKIVHLLIEKGADIHAPGIDGIPDEALHIAVQNNFEGIVRLLIENGADARDD